MGKRTIGKAARALASLALCLSLGLGLCGRAAAAGYQDLGTLRVSVNGEIYGAQALRGDGGDIYLPASVGNALGRTLPTISYDGQVWANVSETDSCVYDEALSSLYIWDGLPAQAPTADKLYPALGDVSDGPITYREFFQMLDAAAEIAAGSVPSGWAVQFSGARNSDREMNRLGGCLAILYLAAALGGEYSEFNADWGPVNDRIGDGVWEETDAVYWSEDRPEMREFFPNYYDGYGGTGLGGFQEAEYIYEKTTDENGQERWIWNVFGVAYRYCIGRASLISGNTLYDYDTKANSLHFDRPLTKRDAAAALTRLIDSVPGSPNTPATKVGLNDPEARQADASILTPELLDWAKNQALPERWNGGVLSPNQDYESRSIDVQRAELTARKLSEYGFNCLRYMLTYQTLFDTRVTTVNLSELRKLDQVVAAALRYNLHLNLVTFSMPGRWSDHTADFQTGGEFDLFTNADRQTEALAVWALLAERYRDVPAAALSFQPLWEVMNQNLSTGCPVEPYTTQDAAPVYAELAKTIHAIDPDRLVIYEPTADNREDQTREEAAPFQEAMEGNKTGGPVQLLTNFCATAYVYAEMPPVGTGADIDNHTHSMFKPEYPVTVYEAQTEIRPGTPLLIKSLPAGTTVTVFLERNDPGAVTITADGNQLLTEPLEEGDYSAGLSPLSGLYPYAESGKSIAVTLSQETAELSIAFESESENGFLRWSGIRVDLPEEYARERWWFPSDYDAFLESGETGPHLVPELRQTSRILISPVGGRPSAPITVDAENLSYSTDYVADRAGRETVFRWGETVSGFAPGSATRVERAAFSIGTHYSSALAYYGDVLDMCDAYGLGWFTNDTAFNELFQSRVEEDPASTRYVGGAYTPCADGSVLRELLQLYQDHMPEGKALPPTEQYPPAGSQVFLAAYSPQGQMLSIEEGDPAQWPPSQSGTNRRAFLTDRDFRPLETR